MHHFHEAISLITRHKMAFVALSLAFFGLLLAAMAVAMFVPDLQTYFQDQAHGSFEQPGILRWAAGLYGSRQLLMAIAATFFVNLTVSVTMTTLPSFIFPFTGILITLYRGVIWGFSFAPLGPYGGMMMPHSLTLVIEGMAYVLGAFAAYVHARMFLLPDQYGLGSHWEGYKAGAVAVARLYILIVLMLLIGAIYEGIEVIYLVPQFL
ncbi:hypothetical protein [Roseococcus pinisoli]|uniref:Stage II sporulation protein M n=1 Tax=Roseococcus pinisoli TaxID=2835040 RepID=A0ABS5Q8F1_9PROT|nr:hypothetical protein [Roseococcus pinisoli]MBS7809773.1 stage II sporulation protein M [Roseococcus pinisoli]